MRDARIAVVALYRRRSNTSSGNAEVHLSAGIAVIARQAVSGKSAASERIAGIRGTQVVIIASNASSSADAVGTDVIRSAGISIVTRQVVGSKCADSVDT